MHRTSAVLRALLSAAALSGLTACADVAPTAPAARPATARAFAISPTVSAGATQECRPDAKLIGRIELSTRDEPGTWWHLTRTGFDAAGVTDYLAVINGEFGSAFPDLATAVAAVVDAVRFLDENGNGFVCAYSGRGTLGWNDDPNFWLYHFIVRDDKHSGS